MKKYVLLSYLFLAACSDPVANDLYNPPLETENVVQAGGSIEVELTPKAEVLFVIDDSASMKKHLELVTKQMDQFIEAFTKNNPFEYNLATVSVYDSRTYESPDYQAKFVDQEKFFLGQLRPVLNTHGERLPDKNFISSKDTDLKGLLNSTLKLQVRELNKGGPEVEEMFSPVKKVFGLMGEAPTDTKFLLGDDAFKIIFFITDADDNSFISASELYQSLVSKAQGRRDRVLAFGAIIPDSASCARDPGVRQGKIENFLALARKPGEGSNLVNLCDSNADLGAAFKRLGNIVKERAKTPVIELKDRIPVINGNPDETLRVFYGDQEIPMEVKNGVIGFKYDPSSNSVMINPAFKFNYQEGVKLRVQFQAVHQANIRNGRVRQFGK